MDLLATIDIDGGGGKGGLFFRDKGIWCVDLHNDDDWDTETPCTREEAVQTIKDAWGLGFDLQWE